jgi:predicted Zn-dependent protease
MRKAIPFIIILCLSTTQVFATPAKNAQAEKEYGDAWAELGNYKRAVGHYNKAIKLNPKMAAARLSLANGLYRLGDKKGALAELNQLRKVQPKSAAVACAAGVIQLDLNQAKLACQSFDRAVVLDKNHQRSLFGLGECHHSLFETNKKKSEKELASKNYQAYLKRFPNGAHAIAAKESLNKLLYGQAGKVLAEAKVAFAKGKFRLAEKMLNQVVKDNPEMSEAHYLLGQTLATPVINKIEKANQAWAKAGQMKEALLQRAILAYEDEDLEDSEDLLKQAVKLDPKYAEAHYQLGLVYRDQLKNDKAIVAFREVVALKPKTALAERSSSKLQMITGQLTFLNEGEIIDTASEIELGRKFTKQMEAKFGLVEDQKLQQRLNQILRRLTAHSDRPPSAVPYRVKVLNIEGINALAFVGGTIYLCKGLVDFIRRDMDDSDDAYAVVIGHEVVHVVLRHGLGMLDLVGGTRRLMEGHSLDIRGVNKLMLGLSRKHEFEADQIGCLYAYRAGFNPAAAYQFHRKLISRGKEVPAGLDHPTHAERADRMKEYLLSLRTKARHFDSGLKALDTNDNESAIIHFEIFLGMFPQSWSARNNLGVAMHRLALSVQKDKRDYKLSTDIDPRSQIKPIRLRSADQAGPGLDKAMMLEAAEVFRMLSKRNPDYLSARLNYGSCLLALGKKEEAQKSFKTVLAKVPDSVEAQTNLAVTQLLNKQVDQGIELLKKIIKKNPEFADARYNLALALTKSGQKDQARKAWLAFLERDEKSGWAESAKKYLVELNKTK